MIGRRSWLLSFAGWPTFADSSARIDGTVRRAFGARRGAVALIALPTGTLAYAWQRSSNEPRRELPGSAIKPLLLASALDGGFIEPQFRIPCPAHFAVAGHNLTCMHPRTAAGIDGATALAYSCNHYFVQIGRRLPGGSAAQSLRSYDCGEVRDPTNREDAALQAIGLWGVHVTPRQLATAYATLAGRRRQNEARLQPVFAGLEGAVQYGTAQLARNPLLPVAAKTGTARNGWIAGYAPASAPLFSFAILVESGNGPGDAAEIARTVLPAYEHSLR